MALTNWPLNMWFTKPKKGNATKDQKKSRSRLRRMAGKKITRNYQKDL